jgi:SAM-dependent methyltransferase
VRGWGRLYATSVGLGLRCLLRHGYEKEALVRILVPMDPSRYLELPWALRELRARPGRRVLDLASPKLLAVALAREGLAVTSVDELEREIASWRALADHERNLTFQIADGRALPFPDASVDGAYSISVLEHIAEPGDEQALRELARVVRPGGRVLVTVPHSLEYREDWRDVPTYVDHGAIDGRYFFQRWYDEERLDQLVAATAQLELASCEIVRMQPNWNAAYVRLFPWLAPLGPFFGVLARERRGPGGDVARLVFVKVG